MHSTKSSLRGWRCRGRLRSGLKLRRGLFDYRDFLLLAQKQVQGWVWSEVAPLPGWSNDDLQDNLRALTIWRQQGLCEPLPPALSTALALLELPCTTSVNTVESNVLLTDSDSFSATTARVLKLKVGGRELRDDITRINHILSHLTAFQRLRLDANQCWQPDDLVQLQSSLIRPEAIDYIEEPLQSRDYGDWSNYCDFAYALDESLQQQVTLPEIQPALKAFVLKPTLLGWQKTHALKQFAQQQGIQVVLSSSFESPVGIRSLQALAAHWQLSDVQGLATAHYFDCQWSQIAADRGDFPLQGQVDYHEI